MRRLGLVSSTLICLPLALSPAAAQGTPAAPDRDPEAMAALDKMGTSLRSLRNFGLHADITNEEVLSSGQKLQYSGSIDMAVRRPDGLRVVMRSDRSDRDIYYDGKTFTVYAPTLEYYANFQAPATLRETMAVAADKYNIEIPLADLFNWGEDADQVARVRTAFRVGSDLVNGQMCTHYAMRQALVDWQVWLDEARGSLPCKLVITNRQDPANPQYSVLYKWLPSLKFTPGYFNFTPPKGAHEIAIAAAAADSGKEAK